MKRTGTTSDSNRANKERPSFLNAEHYREALRICSDLTESIDRGAPEPPPGIKGRIAFVRAGDLRVDEENRLLPVDGHLSFYSDLLGFTNEVSVAGMGSLPDYFGGALIAASQYRGMSVYLVSDSCFATTPLENGDEFTRFVNLIVSRWFVNGLIPQCAIGYGSFVERQPFREQRPPNFFGTQVSGTALADAAGLLKRNKPFGARVLVSESARSHWPTNHTDLIIPDGQSWEFVPTRSPAEHLQDCIYYLLCLRPHAPSSRAFQHYVWSFASRAVAARRGVARLAFELVRPLLPESCYGVALREVTRALKRYGSAASSLH